MQDQSVGNPAILNSWVTLERQLLEVGVIVGACLCNTEEVRVVSFIVKLNHLVVLGLFENLFCSRVAVSAYDCKAAATEANARLSCAFPVTGAGYCIFVVLIVELTDAVIFDNFNLIETCHSSGVKLSHLTLRFFVYNANSCFAYAEDVGLSSVYNVASAGVRGIEVFQQTILPKSPSRQ